MSKTFVIIVVSMLVGGLLLCYYCIPEQQKTLAEEKASLNIQKTKVASEELVRLNPPGPQGFRIVSVTPKIDEFSGEYERAFLLESSAPGVGSFTVRVSPYWHWAAFWYELKEGDRIRIFCREPNSTGVRTTDAENRMRDAYLWPQICRPENGRR